MISIGEKDYKDSIKRGDSEPGMTWLRCPKCHEKAYFPYRCAMDGEEIVCHECGAVVLAERRAQ